MNEVTLKNPIKASQAHAWMIWLLGALFMFYKYALEVSPSVMASTLMSTFHINGAALGHLAACYFYAYLILQIPAGLLLDKIGPRKVTTIAIALCAIGSLLFAQADSLLLAGVGRFITGAGAAFAAVSCLKLIASWFSSKQFALMTGLMMTIAMLGAVGGQAPLSAFIEMMDWRTAMQVIGLAGLVLAVIFWLIVRDQGFAYPAMPAAPSASKISILKSLGRILKNQQSWWLSLYSGFAFAPVMVFGGLWGVSFMTAAFNLSQQAAAHAISFIFIGFAVGAPIFGWLSDRLGRRIVVMSWGTLVALFSITAVIYLPGIPYSFLSLLLFIFGLSISSFLLCFTMIREISPAILAGAAIGFMNAFDALLGAFSDPFTGKLLDMGWNGTLINGARVFSVEAYKMAFLTLPAYLLLSLFILTRIKETHCKELYPTTSE